MDYFLLLQTLLLINIAQYGIPIGKKQLFWWDVLNLLDNVSFLSVLSFSYHEGVV